MSKWEGTWQCPVCKSLTNYDTCIVCTANAEVAGLIDDAYSRAVYDAQNRAFAEAERLIALQAEYITELERRLGEEETPCGKK
jgi:hypothetical protein